MSWYRIKLRSFLWLNNVPSYGYAAFGLSIHLLMEGAYPLFYAQNSHGTTGRVPGTQFEDCWCVATGMFGVWVGQDCLTHTLAQTLPEWLGLQTQGSS